MGRARGTPCRGSLSCWRKEHSCSPLKHRAGHGVLPEGGGAMHALPAAPDPTVSNWSPSRGAHGPHPTLRLVKLRHRLFQQNSDSRWETFAPWEPGKYDSKDPSWCGDSADSNSWQQSMSQSCRHMNLTSCSKGAAL